MNPSDKSPQMTKFLERLAGRTTAITTSKCVSAPFGCGRDISPDEIKLWGPSFIREYRISGLCNKCQQEVFFDPED